MTQDAGPNGATSSYSYDQYARPQSTTSALGAIPQFAYKDAARESRAVTNGKVVKTTMDGFGRPVKVETGTGGLTGAITVISTVETEYAACACTPMGKVKLSERMRDAVIRAEEFCWAETGSYCGLRNMKLPPFENREGVELVSDTLGRVGGFRLLVVFSKEKYCVGLVPPDSLKEANTTWITSNGSRITTAGVSANAPPECMFR